MAGAKRPRGLGSLSQALVLDRAQLFEIRDCLRQRIEEGLNSSGQEIQALPTYLPLPREAQSGVALVMDTGGTNMRASVVRLGDQHEVLQGPVGKKVPGRGPDALHGDQFFQVQAELLAQLEVPANAPLGYCFSYPSEVLPSRDARLVRWTKGLEIEGVEGTLVGKRLVEALARQEVRASDVTVLNDTVASLLGGALFEAQARFETRYIGLIVGTGTNMAGVFSEVSKVPDWSYPEMLVNLESGNFHPPYLSEFDDALDASTQTPGQQRFEKAVSGHYLPFLFDQILPGVLDPERGSAQLVELRESGQGEAQQVAERLLARSADLVAAGLAAVCEIYSPGTTAILGEGSLLWGDPKFSGRLESKLQELLSGGRQAEILRQRDNVNLYGAASAALIGGWPGHPAELY